MTFALARWRSGLLTLATLLLGATALGALAQEPPGRVARLNQIEGVVRTLTPLNPDWAPAEYNHPLTARDRLWVDRGSRFELHTGSATWRMEGPGQLDLSALDDQTAQLQVRDGPLAWRVRGLAAGERIEIDTPNLALIVQQPGDYRVDVDLQRRQTRVTVLQGSLTAYGEAGNALALSGPRQWLFDGRQLALAAPTALPGRDGFDAWVADRNRLEDQSLSARYLPREVIGYQPLDQYGDWSNDPGWGTVWFPRVTVGSWAPYRYGQWRWIEPWGWTWIDDAPWGFAPFHYGRWVVIGERWAWVPGSYERRPVYAPALVGFLGTPSYRPGHGPQRPGVSWVPLAPGEVWQPGYPVSPGYLGQVNRPWERPSRPWPVLPRPPGGGYAHQAPPAVPTAPAIPIGRPPVQAVPQPLPKPGVIEVPQPRERPGVQVLPSPGTAPRTEAERQLREQQQREAQQRQVQDMQWQAERQQQAERQRIEQQQRDQMLREQQQREQLQRQQQQMQQQQMQQQREQAQREQMMREQAQREAVQRELSQRNPHAAPPANPAPAVGGPPQRVGPASPPGYRGLQGDNNR